MALEIDNLINSYVERSKEILKEKLKTIYHTRISYPELQGD